MRSTSFSSTTAPCGENFLATWDLAQLGENVGELAGPDDMFFVGDPVVTCGGARETHRTPWGCAHQVRPLSLRRWNVPLTP